MAAQEAPFPEVHHLPFSGLDGAPHFPSGRLPYPDRQAGRMPDGIPSQAAAFFRATRASFLWRLDEIPEAAKEESGQFYL